MARPESRDRGAIIYPNIGKLVSHRQSSHKVRRTHSGSGVNPNNVTVIKRSRLDSVTAPAVKEDLMHVLTADVKVRYDKLHRKVYFKPPVHFNRVRLKDSDVIGGTVQVLTPASQLSDVREDESMQRVHGALSEMLRACDDGPMFLLFSLDFDNYLNDADGLAKARQRQRRGRSSSKAAREEETRGVRTPEERNSQTGQSSVQFFSDRQPHKGSAAQPTSAEDDLDLDLSVFRRPRDLDPGRQRGRFDILVIHPQRGFMIFKVKAIGDAFSLGEGPQSHAEQLESIRKKLLKAVDQLNKEAEVLRYLVGDLNAGLTPITKGLMLPNLQKQTARLAIMQDPILMQKFRDIVGGGATLERALEKCIFSDQLPPMGQSLDTTDDVILNLRRDWWDKLVTPDSGYRMNEQLYEAILARFCGPGTTQLVRTWNNQYADVSTLPQAVQETARCFSNTVLTEQQVQVLSLDHGRVYLTGPPGTGKSVVLKVKARELARQGETVLIASFWAGSKAASRSLHHEVKQRLPASSKLPSLCVCDSSRLEDILVEVLKAVDPSRNNPTTSTAQTLVPPRSADEDDDDDDDDVVMDCPSEDDGDGTFVSTDTDYRKQSPLQQRLSYKPEDDGVFTYGSFGDKAAVSRNNTAYRTQNSTPLSSLEERHDADDDDVAINSSAEDEEPTVGSYYTHSAYRTDYSVPLRLLQKPIDDDDDDLVTDCPSEDKSPTISGTYRDGGQAVRTTGIFQFSPPSETGQDHSDFKKNWASIADPVRTDPSYKSTVLAAARKNQADLKKKPTTTSTAEEYQSILKRKSSTTANQYQPDSNRRDKVYIFADEAPWFLDIVVQLLEASLGKDGFVLWAASSFPPRHLTSYHQVTMTQSLRNPPVVVRELQATSFYRTFQRHPYTSLDTGVIAGLPSPTNGPPVKRIQHQEHKDEAKTVWDCQRCGLAVAQFLLDDLHIMKANPTGEDSKENAPLRFSDVLISGYNVPPSPDTQFFNALRSKGVPFHFLPGQGMVNRQAVSIETDAVQVAKPESVLGLERPVVVAMGTGDVRETFPRYVDPWYDVISRCTSQLIVVGEPEPSLRDMMKSLWLTD